MVEVLMYVQTMQTTKTWYGNIKNSWKVDLGGEGVLTFKWKSVGGNNFW